MQIKTNSIGSLAGIDGVFIFIDAQDER